MDQRQRMGDDGIDIRRESDGTLKFFRDGVLHREEGPAVVRPCPGGSEKLWYRSGKLHRDDGPAIERENGRTEHWLNGERWLDGPWVLLQKAEGRIIEKTNPEEDGVELKVQPDGTVLWYRYDVLHRDDGPAVIRPCRNGQHDFFWYQYGKEHRDDGPAEMRGDGTRSWYLDGKRHRADGPAIEFADGSKEYYLNGECWKDGASVIARQRAEQAKAKTLKPDLRPGPGF